MRVFPWPSLHLRALWCKLHWCQGTGHQEPATSSALARTAVTSAVASKPIIAAEWIAAVDCCQSGSADHEIATGQHAVCSACCLNFAERGCTVSMPIAAAAVACPSSLLHYITQHHRPIPRSLRILPAHFPGLWDLAAVSCELHQSVLKKPAKLSTDVWCSTRAQLARPQQGMPLPISSGSWVCKGKQGQCMLSARCQGLEHVCLQIIRGILGSLEVHATM